MSKEIAINPTFEKALEEVSKSFAVPRSEARKAQSCVICGGEAKAFKNAISLKEYTLSGMCQKCQDSFFDNDEEE